MRSIFSGNAPQLHVHELDGRVMHAELQLPNGSSLMLNDEVLCLS